MTVAARVYFHQTSRESMGVIFSPAADGPALHVRAGPLSRPRALAAALGARTPWRPFGPLAFAQTGTGELISLNYIITSVHFLTV